MCTLHMGTSVRSLLSLPLVNCYKVSFPTHFSIGVVKVSYWRPEKNEVLATAPERRLWKIIRLLSSVSAPEANSRKAELHG